MNSAFVHMELEKKFISASDNVIIIWALENAGILKQLIGHTDNISHLVYFKATRKLVSASDDQTIIVWDIETGQQLIKFNTNIDVFTTCLLAKEPDLLYVGDSKGGLWCWKLDFQNRNFQLLWATNHSLHCNGVNLDNVHIYKENKQLMLGHGAFSTN